MALIEQAVCDHCGIVSPAEHVFGWWRLASLGERVQIFGERDVEKLTYCCLDHLKAGLNGQVPSPEPHE